MGQNRWPGAWRGVREFGIVRSEKYRASAVFSACRADGARDVRRARLGGVDCVNCRGVRRSRARPVCIEYGRVSWTLSWVGRVCVVVVGHPLGGGWGAL